MPMFFLMLFAAAVGVYVGYLVFQQPPVAISVPPQVTELQPDAQNTVTLVGTTPSGCKIWQVEGPRMVVPLVFVESSSGHVATR